MKAELVEGLVLILTTETDIEKARLLGKALLEEKLICCVSYNRIQSMFRWEGSIQESDEIQMLIKSKKSNVGNIIKLIKKSHSYNLPEIITSQVSSSSEFVNWAMSVMD